MQRPLRLFCLLLALGCIAGAWRIWKLEESLQVLRASAPNDRDLVRWRRDAAQAAADETGPRQRLVDLAAEEKKRATGGARSTITGSSPEYRRLLVDVAKSGLDAQYSSLFQSLIQDSRFSPASIEQFKDLLAARSVIPFDLTMTARAAAASGEPMDQTAFNQASAQMRSASDAAISDVLGSTGYAQFQDYQRFHAADTVAVQLAGSMPDGAPAMTDAQRDQLTHILAAAQAAARPNDNRVPGFSTVQNPDQPFPITDAVIAQAGAVLNPDQLVSLRQLQVVQQARLVVQRELRAVGQKVAQEEAGEAKP